MTRLTKLLMILVLSLVALLATSCSAVKFVDENTDSAELVITYATMKVIGASSDPEARAERVAQIVDVALAAAGDKEALISAIAAAVTAEIDWDTLDPADRFLVSKLIRTVEEDISAKTGVGQLDGDGLLRVETVLQWVKAAAEFAA